MALANSPGGFWRSVRQLPARTPLRVKLITAVLALVAVALIVISLAGIAFLRNYLMSQAESSFPGLSGELANNDYVQHVVVFGSSPSLASGIYAGWISSGRLQTVWQPVGQAPRNAPMPGPDIPVNSGWLTAHAYRSVVVSATSGSNRWLVEVLPDQRVPVPGGGQVTGTVVLGQNVTSVFRTLGRLTAIDVVVSGVVLLGLAIVGVAVIRSSLRPLVDIERTAGAIAAGDLARRVPERDPRTEMGRLGRSLNAMLSQIEFAFRSRADSETAARRSEERMRQFVADASHELRTPLTAIRGFAEYYRQRGGVAGSQDAATDAAPGLEPADLNRIMRRVEQEAARMGVLVEDMLLLARLDQQRPLDRQTVDLLALAADAVHDARVVAPDRAINLTVGAGAALLVLGDETRLRQVVGNLMSNALTHTPAGTPVEIRLRSGSLAEAPAAGPPAAAPGPPSPAAVLEVADAGPGLTPEQAERVFERFYRVDTARTTGGTGLGLAIVAALVAAHDGRVWVQSGPDGGAVFRIALPLAPEALPLAPEALPLAPEARPADEPAPSGADQAAAGSPAGTSQPDGASAPPAADEPTDVVASPDRAQR